MDDHSANHHLVQAEVAPADPDGVQIAWLGTTGWTLAAVVCWWQLDALRARGDAWWLATCVAGIVIGLVGVAWCHRRARDSRG